MDELLTLIVKSYGLVGVLIVLPIGAAVVLWIQNKGLHLEVLKQTQIALEAQKERTEDQKTRVADTERMMERLMDVVREQTALNTELNSVLTRVSESVEKLERRTFLGDRA